MLRGKKMKVARFYFVVVRRQRVEEERSREDLSSRETLLHPHIPHSVWNPLTEW